MKQSHLEKFRQKNRHDPIQVLIPKRWIALFDILIIEYGTTYSAILRLVLTNPDNIQIVHSKRPAEHTETMHRVHLSMYGKDKIRHRQKALHLGMEFAPYLRSLINHYGPILHEIFANLQPHHKRFENIQAAPETETPKPGCCVITQQTNAFPFSEIRPNSIINNVRLHLFGKWGVWYGDEEILLFLDRWKI